MMAVAHPKLGLRPYLPDDAPLLREIFRDSIEELTAEDYTEAQQEAWASVADDAPNSARSLAGQLTLVATLEGSPVGFASLEGNDKIDMLYVHPAAVGQGVGAMLIDALEKLAGGRGAAKLSVDASDSARGFFEKRGYVAQQRKRFRSATNGSPTPRCTSNLPPNGRLHDQARHAVPAPLALLHRAQIRRAGRGRADRALRRLPADCEAAMATRAPLSLRHHAARRRADERRRFHARRQAGDCRHARRARHRLCRGRLSRRQSDRHRTVRERTANSTPPSRPSA